MGEGLREMRLRIWDLLVITEKRGGDWDGRRPRTPRVMGPPAKTVTEPCLASGKTSGTGRFVGLLRIRPTADSASEWIRRMTVCAKSGSWELAVARSRFPAASCWEFADTANARRIVSRKIGRKLLTRKECVASGYFL